jgi:hypothetical protein
MYFKILATRASIQINKQKKVMHAIFDVLVVIFVAVFFAIYHVFHHYRREREIELLKQTAQQTHSNPITHNKGIYNT